MRIDSRPYDEFAAEYEAEAIRAGRSSNEALAHRQAGHEAANRLDSAKARATCNELWRRNLIRAERIERRMRDDWTTPPSRFKARTYLDQNGKRVVRQCHSTRNQVTPNLPS